MPGKNRQMHRASFPVRAWFGRERNVKSTPEIGAIVWVEGEILAVLFSRIQRGFHALLCSVNATGFFSIGATPENSLDRSELKFQE